MEGFRIDLKTFLGLAKPNQYSQSARKQISSWFWGNNFGPKSPNLHDPYIYIVLPYYMIVFFYLGQFPSIDSAACGVNLSFYEIYV